GRLAGLLQYLGGPQFLHAVGGDGGGRRGRGRLVRLPLPGAGVLVRPAAHGEREREHGRNSQRAHVTQSVVRHPDPLLSSHSATSPYMSEKEAAGRSCRDDADSLSICCRHCGGTAEALPRHRKRWVRAGGGERRWSHCRVRPRHCASRSWAGPPPGGTDGNSTSGPESSGPCSPCCC